MPVQVWRSVVCAEEVAARQAASRKGSRNFMVAAVLVVEWEQEDSEIRLTVCPGLVASTVPISRLRHHTIKPSPHVILHVLYKVNEKYSPRSDGTQYRIYYFSCVTPFQINCFLLPNCQRVLFSYHGFQRFQWCFYNSKAKTTENPSGRGGGLNNQYQKTSVFFTSVLILTFHRMTTHFNSLIHDTAVNY